MDSNEKAFQALISVLKLRSVVVNYTFQKLFLGRVLENIFRRIFRSARLRNCGKEYPFLDCQFATLDWQIQASPVFG